MIRRQIVVVSILLSIIIALTIFRVHMLNSTGVDVTEELASVQEELRQMRRENDDLHRSYLQVRSLGWIDAQARSQGFVPVAEYVFLDN